MNLTRQFFRLAILGAVNHQVTHICVAGSIFEDTRQGFKSFHPRLGELVSCHLCLGTWVGMLLALLFHPGFIKSSPRQLPLQRPKRSHQLAAFFADAFAIALAGRFYTEVLAILAGQAAVQNEQRELIEKQLDQVGDDSAAGLEAGEPVAKPG